MAKKIRFSVHQNPLKDKDGNTTYQVRHENWRTMDTSQLISHMKLHNNIVARMVEPVLDVLREEIVEQLIDNYRLHLNGLGTFYLKIGFREHSNGEGRVQRPTFTNAAQITGDDVAIQGIGFTPDAELLGTLEQTGYYFENVQRRGQVGKSATHTTEHILQQLNNYLDCHDFITRPAFCKMFGLTRHMARKHLQAILQDPSSGIVEAREGNIYLYKRG